MFVEVKRLTIQDVRWKVVDVWGKGRGEGNWRIVPWARETLVEIRYYQRLREEMIGRALEHDPIPRSCFHDLMLLERNHALPEFLAGELSSPASSSKAGWTFLRRRKESTSKK